MSSFSYRSPMQL